LGFFLLDFFIHISVFQRHLRVDFISIGPQFGLISLSLHRSRFFSLCRSFIRQSWIFGYIGSQEGRLTWSYISHISLSIANTQNLLRVIGLRRLTNLNWHLLFFVAAFIAAIKSRNLPNYYIRFLLYTPWDKPTFQSTIITAKSNNQGYKRSDLP
jgi:hypothetical protein